MNNVNNVNSVYKQCIARCYLHLWRYLLPFGQQNMCLYSNIYGYMHIIRFLPQENESQCASLVCTPDRQERQTTKLIENIKCSESVGPKHQSYVVNPQVFLGLAMSILALLTHRLSISDPSRSQNSRMKGQQKHQNDIFLRKRWETVIITHPVLVCLMRYD